jgi:hypothetical protein
MKSMKSIAPEKAFILDTIRSTGKSREMKGAAVAFALVGAIAFIWGPIIMGGW